MTRRARARVIATESPTLPTVDRVTGGRGGLVASELDTDFLSLTENAASDWQVAEVIRNSHHQPFTWESCTSVSASIRPASSVRADGSM